MEVLIWVLVCAAGCAVVGRVCWRGRPEGPRSRRVEGDSSLGRVEELLDRRLEELEERVDFSEKILMGRSEEERSDETR